MFCVDWELPLETSRALEQESIELNVWLHLENFIFSEDIVCWFVWRLHLEQNVVDGS